MIACGCLGCDGPGGESAASTGRDSADAVVTIRATGCRSFVSVGTGTIVDRDLVLTAAHPVAGETTITVTTSDGRTLDAAIAAIDTVNDVAVLRVHGATPPGPSGTEATDHLELTIESEPGAATVLLVEGPRPIEIVRRVDIVTSDIYLDGEHTRRGLELPRPHRARRLRRRRARPRRTHRRHRVRVEPRNRRSRMGRAQRGAASRSSSAPDSASRQKRSSAPGDPNRAALAALAAPRPARHGDRTGATRP